MLVKKLMYFIFALMFAMFIGCSDDSDDGGSSTVTSDFDVLQPIVDASVNVAVTPIMTAQVLYDNINDGDDSNNYVVVSVRSAAHYEAGHIPGAININWRDIAKTEKLAALDARIAAIPNNGKIAVYCYTGHTGGVATTILRALGYDAYNLKFGIMDWTKDEAARGGVAPFSEATSFDYEIETTINASSTYELANPEFSSSTNADEIMLAAADLYASLGSATYNADVLHGVINDGDTSNDPQIISVRSADHYAIGHIPGAINIPWKEIASEDNLKKIDPTRLLVVYCYTGHTGGIATTALNLLGYNAVNLKHGIMSWTKSTAARGGVAPFSEATGHDYPVTTGVNP
ncbi:MAG: rhodanese-like domain-containing protein [Calditrichaceae bacterium]